MTANDVGKIYDLLRGISADVGAVKIELADVRGDIRVLQADRPARGEITEIVKQTVAMCPHRGEHRPKSPDLTSAIIKISLAAVALAGAVVALLHSVLT